MLDKIKGAILGVAIGDALGATTEFMTREEIQEQFGKVTNIVGGGHWELEPGEVTDDTQMTIGVMKGIMANSLGPIAEIGKQFLKWNDTAPKGIGNIIATVFHQYNGDWFAAAETAHHMLDNKSAGNGSLMRCLPIALAYSDKEKIKKITTLHSKMTHYDDLATEACVIYNNIASNVLEGAELRESILQEVKNTRYDSDYTKEPDCPPDGYVVYTMKWVLYWLLNGESFEDVVLGATNMGNDSDTIAAIAGGLKGMEVGYEQLPKWLVGNLKCWRNYEAYAEVLYLIRDKDTEQLREGLGKVLVDLRNEVHQLKNLVEQEATQQEKLAVLENMKKNIHLFRIAFQDDDQDFDKKLKTWHQVLNRYQRTKRLIDLGAPKIIKLHEIAWFSSMINHLDLRYKGKEPTYTTYEQEELKTLKEQGLLEDNNCIW